MMLLIECPKQETEMPLVLFGLVCDVSIFPNFDVNTLKLILVCNTRRVPQIKYVTKFLKCRHSVSFNSLDDLFMVQALFSQTVDKREGLLTTKMGPKCTRFKEC